MNAMLAEEAAVTTAAIHRVRVHLATQIRTGFDDQTRQPRDAINGQRLRRQLGRRNGLAGEFAAHDHFEVVTTHRRNEQRCFERRPLVAVTAVIIDKVEKLLRGIADGGQKGLLGIGEPFFGTRIARTMEFGATFKNLAEGGVPVEVVNGACCIASRCSTGKVKS